MKIFYYDDVTENLLEEMNAQISSPAEIIEELYFLSDDNISYVGFEINDDKFKVVSSRYDDYSIFHFDSSFYSFLKSVNFEDLKFFINNL